MLRWHVKQVTLPSRTPYPGSHAEEVIRTASSRYPESPPAPDGGADTVRLQEVPKEYEQELVYRLRDRLVSAQRPHACGAGGASSK